MSEAEQAAVRPGPPSTKHGRGDGGEGWLRLETVLSAKDNIFILGGEPRSYSLLSITEPLPGWRSKQ